jgi:hypothetical protein
MLREWIEVEIQSDPRHADSAIVNDGAQGLFEPDPGRKLMRGIQTQRWF